MPEELFHPKTGILRNIGLSKKSSPVYFASELMLQVPDTESCEVTEYG
jgi:hypothetical protein